MSEPEFDYKSLVSDYKELVAKGVSPVIADRFLHAEAVYMVAEATHGSPFLMGLALGNSYAVADGVKSAVK